MEGGSELMRTVCVFCGSNGGGDPVYSETARRLGVALVGRGLDLVYGGGHVGLMGVVADAVLAARGRVVGVINRALVEKELAHGGLTELLVVETMHQRKALMADRADAFVALPGGFGTLDELFEILTWRQLGMHAKPIGLLNVAGYFDRLMDWIAHSVREQFVKEKHRDLLLVADDPERLVDMLQSYRAPPGQEKWLRPGEG
jgi:uncharacterized protein (TIGR00730 family)